MQDSSPLGLSIWPAGHALHNEAAVPPIAPYTDPDGHEAHSDSPVDARYVPGPHALHLVCISSAWNVPASQVLHTAAPNVVKALYVPWSQSLQLVTALADSLWYFPWAQCLHTSCAAKFWYVPAPQKSHSVAPAAANLPASQSSQAEVPVLRNFPASQVEHVVAPATVSWWQSWHAVAPRTPL